MRFKIEYSDGLFRVVAPDGEFEEAVGFCNVSTVTYNGEVYGAYLTGDEPEIEQLDADPEKTEMVTSDIKVYNLTNWPELEPVETVIESIDFDEVETA